MRFIQKKLLNVEVANRIREMIGRGVLKKGDKINERELADELGVSRTPVREAMQMLSTEGLIQMVPHKGAYVSHPKLEDITEMFEVMAILEGTCAKMAAERMSEIELRRLEGLHEQLEKYYSRRDHEKYLKVNHLFHTYLQQLTGNTFLNEVINGIRQKILLYRSQQLYQPRRFDESIAEHRALLEAIKERDADLAEERMKVHLMNQCKALVSVYEGKEG